MLRLMLWPTWRASKTRLFYTTTLAVEEGRIMLFGYERDERPAIVGGIQGVMWCGVGS